ncbi:MAG: peptidoglycan editing factor PgeF [Rhodocyclaceae bacterium]|nr:peptidoglycan editing factor PgeF [Rhodocyclaceae bacterium]
MPKPEAVLAGRRAWPADWIVPDWPAPPGVRALCTTRAGGVSEGGYASMNLGDHVGDQPGHVAENRRRLREAIGAEPVFLRQVHGTDCASLATPGPGAPTADAALADAAGIAATVMVADCLPVLLCSEDGRRVAAAHGGWRGLAAGVLEQACASIRPAVPVDAAQAATKIIAWLGPCIGPEAFEVGDEVRTAFVAQAAEAAACFRPGALPGKWLADLPALARQRLQALGIDSVHGNDGSAPWCTVGNPSRFFSYRRDGAGSGRFAALVWRV